MWLIGLIYYYGYIQQRWFFFLQSESLLDVWISPRNVPQVLWPLVRLGVKHYTWMPWDWRMVGYYGA